jgi:hypothetical protein
MTALSNNSAERDTRDPYDDAWAVQAYQGGSVR